MFARFPHKPRSFVGREKDLMKLRSYLLLSDSSTKTENKIILTSTGAGMGKTSLLAVLLEDQEVKNAFGDRRIYVDCTDKRILDIWAGIGHWLGSFDFTKDDLSLRIAHAFLSNDKPRWMLVLDKIGASKLKHKEISGLMQVLEEKIPNVAVVMTCWNKELGVKHDAWKKWHLQALLPNDAVSLLESEMEPPDTDNAITGKDRSQLNVTDNLKELAKLLDYIPLDLAIVGRLMRESEKDAASMINQWNDEPNIERITKTMDLHQHRRKKSIGMSLKHLGPETTSVLRILSAFPAGLNEATSCAVINSIKNWDDEYTLLHLSKLRLQTILREEQAFVLPPSIRAYVRNEKPWDAEEKKKLYLCYLASIRREIEAEEMIGSVAAREYSNYAPILHHILDNANLLEEGQSRSILDTVSLLSKRLSQTAYPPAFISIMDKAFSVSSTVGGTLVKCGMDLAYGLYLQGNYDESCIRLAHMEAACPSNNTNTLAKIKHIMGKNKCLTGDSKGALGLYDQALELYGRSGHKYGQVQCLRSLVHVYLEMNNMDSATTTLAKCRRLLGSVENDEEVVVALAKCERSEGEIALKLKEYGKAIRHFEEADSQFKAINNRLGRAWSLRAIAQAKAEESAMCYREAAALFSESGDHRQADHSRDRAEACIEPRS